MKPSITVKKPGKKAQVWTLAHKEVTYTELQDLTKRAEAQCRATKDGMEATMLLRLAIDADHLARLIESRLGVHRMVFDVSLKNTAKKKPAKK